MPRTKATAKRPVTFAIEVEPFNLLDPRLVHPEKGLSQLMQSTLPVKEMRVGVELSRRMRATTAHGDWDDGFTTKFSRELTVDVAEADVTGDDRLYVTLAMRKELDNAAFNPDEPHTDRLGLAHFPLHRLLAGETITTRFMTPIHQPTNFRFRIRLSGGDAGAFNVDTSIRKQLGATPLADPTHDILDLMNAQNWINGSTVLTKLYGKGGDGNSWTNVMSHQPIELTPEVISDLFDSALYETDGMTREEVEEAVANFVATPPHEDLADEVREQFERAITAYCTMLELNKIATYTQDYAAMAFIDSDGVEKTMWVPCEKEGIALKRFMNDCEGETAQSTNFHAAFTSLPASELRKAGRGVEALAWIANHIRVGACFCAAKMGNKSMTNDLDAKAREAVTRRNGPPRLLVDHFMRGDVAGHCFAAAFVGDVQELDTFMQNGRIRTVPSAMSADAILHRRHFASLRSQARILELTSRCTTRPDSAHRAAAAEFRQVLRDSLAAIETPAERNKFRFAVGNLNPLNPTSAYPAPVVDSMDPRYGNEDAFVLYGGVFFCGDDHCIIGTVDTEGKNFIAGASCGEMYGMVAERRPAIMHLHPAHGDTTVSDELEDIIDRPAFVMRGNKRKPPPVPKWLKEYETRVNKRSGIKHGAKNRVKELTTFMYPNYAFVANAKTSKIAQEAFERFEDRLDHVEVRVEPIYNDNFALSVRLQLKRIDTEDGKQHAAAAEEARIRVDAAHRSRVLPEHNALLLPKGSKMRERLSKSMYSPPTVPPNKN